MSSSAIIDELSTDARYGHTISGKISNSFQILDMKNIASARLAGPARNFEEYNLLFPRLETGSEEFRCKIIAIQSHTPIPNIPAPKKSFFSFLRKTPPPTPQKPTIGPSFMKLIYNNRTADPRGGSFSEYMISIPAEEAQRIQLAILKDPEILINVYHLVFPYLFEQLNGKNILRMHDNWLDYFQTTTCQY